MEEKDFDNKTSTSITLCLFLTWHLTLMNLAGKAPWCVQLDVIESSVFPGISSSQVTK